MAEAIAIFLLTQAGITATATAVAVTTTLIGLGISVGLSLLAQAFLAPASPGASPADRQVLVRQPTAPRTRSYGRVRVAGSQAFIGADNGTLYRVTCHNDGEIDAVEEHVIDETVVTVDGSGNVTAPAQFAGKVRIYNRLGTDTPAHYASLGAKFGDWDSTHLGKGLTHSLTEFDQGTQAAFFDTYPASENTTYKQTQRSAKIWDPREVSQDATDPSTWTWSDNAALVILDYLRHATGMRVPLALLLPEIESWKAAADACDEAVPVVPVGTVGRYRIWHTYSYNERPADVLQRLLAACNGRLWIGINGGLQLSVGVWTTPTVTIDDAAIDAYALGAGNEGPDAANTLSAVYVEPAQGYRQNEAALWTDAAAVAAQGEVRTDAAFFAVPGHSQCRRLMKQAFARFQPAWIGTVTTNLRALPVLTERFARLQIAELGLDITVEVDNVQFRVEAGGVVTGLILAVTSIDAVTFDWDAATEEGVPSLPPPAALATTIGAPTGFFVSIEDDGGDTVAIAQTSSYARFTDPVNHSRLEYRFPGSVYWQVALSAEGAASVQTLPLVVGEDYEFRIRHVAAHSQSPWSATITREATVDTVAPGAPTGLSVVYTPGNDNSSVQWTNPSSANCFGARVYRNTINDSASAAFIGTKFGGPSVALDLTDTGLVDTITYYYWVAAFNGSSLEGTRTFAGSITVSTGGGPG